MLLRYFFIWYIHNINPHMNKKLIKNTKGFVGIITIFIVFFTIIGAGLIVFVPRTYDIPDVPTIQDGSYRFMTYNLRYSASDYDEWYERRDEIVSLIENYEPDSIGMQEADWGWMDFLPSELDNYSYVGVGRDDGESEGEFAPIFYLTEKFNLLENGTFWLSDTPDEPSYGWDAVCRRICTYAILENRDTGEVFAHFNTHLDHEGEIAREKGAELIINKTMEMEYPVILTGDMNFLEGTKVYDIIEKSNLSDTKFLTDITMAWGTMNYFTNYHFRFIPPIDFIFVTDESIHVDRYEVLYQHRYNGKPLSDHFPVFSDISY